MPSILPSNAIPVTQISLAGTSVTANYGLIGTFSTWLEILNIVNTTDAVILISFDGTNDHITMPVGNTTPAIMPFNLKANSMTLPKPSIFAKTAGSPSTGTVSANGFSSANQ